MAVNSMMQRLLDNALTAKFAKSLKHSDLPEGWADNPEIVQLAEDAYSVMGTESPWFKAWFGNSKVVDEDGLPMPAYHGSTEVFDVFDPTKSRANMDIQGSFFSPWENDAGGYGPNIHEVFLSLQNPANSSKGYKALNAHKGENYAGVSAREDLKRAGYDSVNNDSEEFIAFYPEQVKSTSNRGTFNPADPNIYKGLIPAVGAGGLLALMGPEEAEAAKPAYMTNLVEKMKSGDFREGVDFGEYTKRDLRKKGIEGEGFTPGPVKISPRNLEKFNIKRIGQDNMPFEPFVDGLNSVVHGSRAKAFPNRGDLMMRLAAETDWKDDEPFVQHFWKSVLAPHDGFTGLVTGHKYKPEDAKKDLKRFSGERPSSPFTGTPKEAVTQQGEISAVGETSGLDAVTIPASFNSRKAIIPLTVGGVLMPATAEAYQFPADLPGYVNPEPGLGSPLVDVADILVAPIGAVGAGAKMAAMAAEPFVSYGMDKVINGLFDLFSDEED